MKIKVFNVLVIAISLPLLVEGCWALYNALQRHRPLSAVIGTIAVVVTALLLLAAGGFALRSGRAPDLRLLLAALVVMSLNVYLN